MRIISFNVENIFLKEMSKDKISFIANFLRDNDIDVMNVQELSIVSRKRLKKELKEYNFYGEFRHHKLLNFLPMNENNNIITKSTAHHNKTIRLKTNSFKMFLYKILYFPILPRIATVAIINDKCFINTHISNRCKEIKRRQLEILKDIINKYKSYKIILTGDFNMTLKNRSFQEFISHLESIGLKRVILNDPTWHGRNKEYTLDHIFISKDIEIKDQKIISSNNYSDHDILYIEI